MSLGMKAIFETHSHAQEDNLALRAMTVLPVRGKSARSPDEAIKIANERADAFPARQGRQTMPTSMMRAGKRAFICSCPFLAANRAFTLAFS